MLKLSIFWKSFPSKHLQNLLDFLKTFCEKFNFILVGPFKGVRRTLFLIQNCLSYLVMDQFSCLLNGISDTHVIGVTGLPYLYPSDVLQGVNKLSFVSVGRGTLKKIMAGNKVVSDMIKHALRI